MKNLTINCAPKHSLLALRAFEAVSRQLSITRASAELFVTPGAISQQVRALEASLGIQLLERHHRRISLTPDGVKLAYCLSHCFEQIDRTLMELSGQSRRLSLRLMPTFAIRWLVPQLSSFFGSYPGIEIDMSTVSGADESQLTNVDFAVRLGTGNWEDAESDRLFGDDLVPVCSPVIAASLRSPDDLIGQALLHSVARSEGWQVWLESIPMSTSAFRRHMHFANAALACQAAIDGLGVAIAQRQYVIADLSSGILVAPFPSFGRAGWGYYLVCPKHKAEWPNVRLFRQWIRSIASSV